MPHLHVFNVFLQKNSTKSYEFMTVYVFFHANYHFLIRFDLRATPFVHVSRFVVIFKSPLEVQRPQWLTSMFYVFLLFTYSLLITIFRSVWPRGYPAVHSSSFVAFFKFIVNGSYIEKLWNIIEVYIFCHANYDFEVRFHLRASISYLEALFRWE